MTPDRAPGEYIDVFLQPGELYFAEADTRIRTVLGSCVSITLWHPRLLLGGVCHYLLPSRAPGERELDGRYGDEALFMLLREVRHRGCRPREFQYRLFGGALMSERGDAAAQANSLGHRNVRIAFEMLDDLGVGVHGHDTGGNCSRSLMLDNWSGNVWIRSTEAAAIARADKAPGLIARPDQAPLAVACTDRPQVIA